ncbi:MAG: hypothetical protein CO093_08610 [Alphaproteobacteria bacterium CG_4_9_14_3_um_filter_47_13]|nr:MAG: hypothetical protein CO093_08610 [Alphaproteobacteria bacterium CG_4_9_14_3_um_filter_47_13]
MALAWVQYPDSAITSPCRTDNAPRAYRDVQGFREDATENGVSPCQECVVHTHLAERLNLESAFQKQFFRVCIACQAALALLLFATGLKQKQF